MKNAAPSFLLTLITAIALPLTANASLEDWRLLADSHTRNQVASTNNGAGWVLTGSSGISFDFGNLSIGYTEAGINDGDNPFGASYATLEFIVNLTGSNSSIGSIPIASFTGFYNPPSAIESYTLKLHNNTTNNLLSAASRGVRENTMGASAIPLGETLHLTFVLSSNQWNAYVNGIFVGASSESQWRIWGGTGSLGHFFGTEQEYTVGTIYGVATYNQALTPSDISARYAAYQAIPEPSAMALISASACFAGLALWRKRRTGTI